MLVSFLIDIEFQKVIECNILRNGAMVEKVMMYAPRPVNDLPKLVR